MKRMIFLLAAFTSSCGFDAPSVSRPQVEAIPELEQSSAQACLVDSSSWCVTTYSLKMDESGEQWVYWKAGEFTTKTLSAADVQGLGWDMRLTKYFPIVGSNGGATKNETGSNGSAAFGAHLDINSTLEPMSTQDVLAWDFLEDTFASLDPALPAGNQSPLLNKIGTGILKSYNMGTHAVELSHRVFVLRTADSSSYYLLKFDIYSRQNKIFGFHWRPLK